MEAKKGISAGRNESMKPGEKLLGFSVPVYKRVKCLD